MGSVLVRSGSGERFGRLAQGGSRYRLGTRLTTIGRVIGFWSRIAPLPWPRWLIPLRNECPEYAPLTPSCPSISRRCWTRYSRVNASLPGPSSRGWAKRGASQVQLGLSSYRCRMAVAGPAASLDADSVIVTPLREGSIFEFGSVSSSQSSSNWMDLRVRFDSANQCSQPSRPFEISLGRTDGAKAVRHRPSSRRTECRPSSTVIGRLLYIFRLNPIKPDNVIQASECMKSWCRGRNLWRNRVRNSMDGADAHRSRITVRIVIEMIFL